MEEILLASSSPRRRELLESYGFPLLVRPSDTDESVRDHLPVRERVVALARDKANAVLESSGDADPRWILAADTLVSLGELVLGKPADVDQARSFLRTLAGKAHLVSSGLALADRTRNKLWTAVEQTEVRFAELEDDEIEDYLDSGEWEGVAGAYRIQGRAAFLVERVTGSFSCVVGLPLRSFYVMLRQSGYRMR
jgi:septum formation protein